MDKRMACYDEDLGIEACSFQGIMQKFPNHFHEYYVIGFINAGKRGLTCKGQNYVAEPGDLLLFNPLDNHACEQLDDLALDWRSLNINKNIMQNAVAEITGRKFLPVFNSPVIRDRETLLVLSDLHDMIMAKQCCLNKEETFCFLIGQLISEYTDPDSEMIASSCDEVQKICDYIENNYGDSISLGDLSDISGWNKYVLLRKFTQQRGITPYQYLSTVRIGHARQLLESGVAPAETALQCGFSDQSHFSRFFKTFIGLTPRVYQNIFTEKHKGIRGQR